MDRQHVYRFLVGPRGLAKPLLAVGVVEALEELGASSDFNHASFTSLGSEVSAFFET